MVRLDGVGLRYGDGPYVLHDLNVSLADGAFRWLLGPSGAGKTSLLRLLTLAVRPSSGRMSVLGLDLADARRADLPPLRRRIGMVFQDFRLLPHLSAFDNVALPLRLAGRPEGELRADDREMLRWVGLGRHAAARPAELSGGEQQRVAIARAVIGRPALLLADEPTGNLDDAQADRLMQLLARAEPARARRSSSPPTTPPWWHATRPQAAPGRRQAARCRRQGRRELPMRRPTAMAPSSAGRAARTISACAGPCRTACCRCWSPRWRSWRRWRWPGPIAAAALADHWRMAAAGLVTVQVPQPDARRGRAGAMPPALAAIVPAPSRRLRAAGRAASARRRRAGRHACGPGWARTPPAVPAAAGDVRGAAGRPVLRPALAARLARVAPGTLVERNEAWLDRLADLSRSLQACAALALLIVAFVAAAWSRVATRAGLAARRDAIEIVHGLGATDRIIASRFAGRVTLLGLGRRRPRRGADRARPARPGTTDRGLPAPASRFGVPGFGAGGGVGDAAALPVLAALIGWLTTQLTVRRWLWRLP